MTAGKLEALVAELTARVAKLETTQCTCAKCAQDAADRRRMATVAGYQAITALPDGDRRERLVNMTSGERVQYLTYLDTPTAVRVLMSLDDYARDAMLSDVPAKHRDELSVALAAKSGVTQHVRVTSLGPTQLERVPLDDADGKKYAGALGGALVYKEGRPYLASLTFAGGVPGQATSIVLTMAEHQARLALDRHYSRLVASRDLVVQLLGLDGDLAIFRQRQRDSALTASFVAPTVPGPFSH